MPRRIQLCAGTSCGMRKPDFCKSSRVRPKPSYTDGKFSFAACRFLRPTCAIGSPKRIASRCLSSYSASMSCARTAFFCLDQIFGVLLRLPRLLDTCRPHGPLALFGFASAARFCLSSLSISLPVALSVVCRRTTAALLVSHLCHALLLCLALQFRLHDDLSRTHETCRGTVRHLLSFLLLLPVWLVLFRCGAAGLCRKDDVSAAIVLKVPGRIRCRRG